MPHKTIPVVPVPPLAAAIKGRGTPAAIAHRFSANSREPFDDGWEGQEPEGGSPPVTKVITELAKSALTKPDEAFFVHGLNPYRGCEHGCSYCYARPTHSYLNLSPGIDFETKIIAKTNIAQRLREALLRPGYRPQSLALGTVTDCYQPLEREWRLTRQVIEVLEEFGHPFTIITKGSGIERDLDILRTMASRQLVAVYITLTTLDADLARRLEPRAAAPYRRLRTLATLSQAGIPVGVSLAPQIPFLNDDLEKCLEAAYQAGARHAFYGVLRLPFELTALFTQWLQQHYPQRAERVLARLHELHGSNRDMHYAYVGGGHQGQGVWAQLLAQRFRKTCQGLGYQPKGFALSFEHFRKKTAQGDLFN